ncbi:MAG TPA: cyclic nucleotide-binding domain-containing protein, partial [Candidatus Ozemobacteraceae bacterium]|nr:cyclic nucleotide-binding domain-containing protein [Candidatus Ozemobacteraceae bacterium]
LKREGVSIPFPIREVFTHPEKVEQAQMMEHRLELISQIDFLRDLERPLRALLATCLVEFWFEKSEVIVQKGSTGTDFYLVDKGSVDIFIDFPGGEPVARLAGGQFFGEMSLLTGEPRSATVVAAEETRVLVLSKETMGKVLRDHDELAKILGEALAQRQMANQSIQMPRGNESGIESAEQRYAADLARSRSHFMTRIRKFFGME